jgi:comEA protein
MEIQIKGKSYKIPWEYIIAPFIILLTVLLLFVTNRSAIRKAYIDYSDEPASSAASKAVQASPEPALKDDVKSAQPSEEKSPEVTPQNQSDSNPGKVNINKASMDELMTLPFIGEVKAKAIIDYRSKQGPFKSIDELDNIKGIGAKTLEKLRPLVALE